MANFLTGDYEAVMQIAIRQLNGLLGSIHQNAAIPDATPTLLTSVALRIGDPPRRRPDVDVFADWLLEYRKSSPGRGLDGVRTQLTDAAPPGVARLLTEALAGFDRDWVIELPPDVVRGLAKLQVSTVAVTVPEGLSKVVVHARIRAQYYPDPGTTDLPAPVHGDVQIGFDVRRIPVGSVRRLQIQVSPQDSDIQFVAAAGSVDAVAASRLTAEIRKVLRERFTVLPVDLPADFPFAEFKGVGSGASQAVALPLQLSGAAPPTSGVQSVTHSFVGASGFALAVSDGYVRSLISVDAIREEIKRRSVTVALRRFGSWFSVTYRFHFSEGPTLTFKSGGMEISGRVEATSNRWWAPNGFVSFKQMVMLVLDPLTQDIRPQRAGEPDVDESWFLPHGTVTNIVATEIDKALSANAAAVRDTFASNKNAFVRGLRRFDALATVSYTAIEITPAGVIVHGDIGSSGRRAPVVDVAETHQGAAFTAYKSWIPGGRIDRFVWTWVEYSDPHSIWRGTQRSITDAHRFILPKPAGLTQVSQICLRIEGTQTLANGQQVPVAGGTTCQVPQPEFAIDAPSWWAPLTLPVWRPDVNDTLPLRHAIAGHISVCSNGHGQEPSSRNTLVYFADWDSDKPLDSLASALSRLQNRSSLAVIVVLPAGAFDQTRRDIENRIGSSLTRLDAPVQFTEDNERGWTRMFAVAKPPAAYLVNASRAFVWKHDGEVDPAALSAVLARNPVPKRQSRFRPLRLVVPTGNAVPDESFEDDRKQRFALHRFRGREMVLNFWQSWSAPCLTELGRLQRVHETRRDKPFVVAFHGGENDKVLGEVRERLNLSFPLVQDSHQQIASRYGVRCWPTTLLVGADGRVEHVQFGTEHDHGEAAGLDGLKSAQAPE